jgi:hypothetical protein
MQAYEFGNEEITVIGSKYKMFLSKFCNTDAMKYVID